MEFSVILFYTYSKRDYQLLDLMEKSLKHFPIFAGERLAWGKTGERLVYYLPKPWPHGQTVLYLTPLEWLDRLAPLNGAAVGAIGGRRLIQGWMLPTTPSGGCPRSAILSPGSISGMHRRLSPCSIRLAWLTVRELG